MAEQFDIQAPLKKISRTIASIRETKGRSGESLEMIESALDSAHDFVVTLLLEKHLVYQHEVMEERTKHKKNKSKIDRFTQKMLDSALEAQTYVRENDLERWMSRVQARLGRAYDYTGDFKKALKAYKKAIQHSDKDPEVVEEGVPRNLEYRGFLAYSTMMSGKVKKGVALAESVYEEFERGVGLQLKKQDYPVWAIWRTGVAIRTVDGLLKMKEDFDKEWARAWIDEAEELIKEPRGAKKWIGKVDFGFRRDEVKKLKRELKE